MLDIMSKFLNMGMAIEDIVYRATWSTAQSINREDLGNLSEGSVADIVVLSVRKGSFGFIDTRGNKMAETAFYILDAITTYIRSNVD